MSLSDKQFSFAKDIILLLNYAMSRGWKFTLGEFQRTEEQQRIYMEEGKTLTMDSLHRKKMAGDIFFFKKVDGRYKFTMKKEDLQELGDFWESLDKNNNWGGNWEKLVDTPHFEKEVS